MLSGERWLDARESYVLLKEKWPGVDSDEKEIILAEHYKTQLAIEAFKLQSRTQDPCQIPHMDEIIPHTEITDKATRTSIIGMPNSGKTTTIKIISKTRVFETPVLVNEAYKEEKEKIESQGNLNFETLIVNTVARQYVESLNAFTNAEAYIKAGLSSNTWVIFDRPSFIDIPMIRTHFLLGNIRAATMLYMEEKMFLEQFCAENKLYNDILISTFITPNNALSRQEPNETRGRIMTPPFLSVLYEQYIRFHYEMLNFEKTFKRKREFTYSAIDMSSDDSDVRFRKLEKAIDWSSIAQTGWPSAKDLSNLLKDESW